MGAENGLAALAGASQQGGASFSRAYLDALNRKQQDKGLDFKKSKWKEYLAHLNRDKATKTKDIYSGTRLKEVMKGAGIPESRWVDIANDSQWYKSTVDAMILNWSQNAGGRGGRAGAAGKLATMTENYLDYLKKTPLYVQDPVTKQLSIRGQNASSKEEQQALHRDLVEANKGYMKYAKLVVNDLNRGKAKEDQIHNYNPKPLFRINARNSESGNQDVITLENNPSWYQSNKVTGGQQFDGLKVVTSGDNYSWGNGRANDFLPTEEVVFDPSTVRTDVSSPAYPQGYVQPGSEGAVPYTEMTLDEEPRFSATMSPTPEPVAEEYQPDAAVDSIYEQQVAQGTHLQFPAPSWAADPEQWQKEKLRADIVSRLSQGQVPVAPVAQPSPQPTPHLVQPQPTMSPTPRMSEIF